MTQIPDRYEDVGRGWWGLLSALHSELIQVDPDYDVAQVKEKFGTLRVYLHGNPIQVDMIGPRGAHANMKIEETASKEDWRSTQDIIGRYEELSAAICEECGKYGKLDTSRFWLKTHCPEHTGTRAAPGSTS